MVDVAVIGVGQTKYGTFPEKDMKELFVEAFTESLAHFEEGPTVVDQMTYCEPMEKWVFHQG